VRFLGLWPVALLWLVVPYTEMHPTVHEECPISIHRETYSVTGSSREEIRRSMLDRGPRDERGLPRFAKTEWKVDWRWEKDIDGGIKIDSLSVTCSASILLPQRDPPILADAQSTREAELRFIWSEFLSKLERHELNHLKHVRYRAPHIAARLKEAQQRYGSLSTQRANSIASRVLREIRDLDRRYDIETRHGKSEGVWEIG